MQIVDDNEERLARFEHRHLVDERLGDEHGVALGRARAQQRQRLATEAGVLRAHRGDEVLQERPHLDFGRVHLVPRDAPPAAAREVERQERLARARATGDDGRVAAVHALLEDFEQARA
jgi:hypothetical protein